MSRPTEGRQANLQHLKKQAKDLLRAHKAQEALACHRIKSHLPQYSEATIPEIQSSRLTLQGAQHVLARENGFRNWADLMDQVRGSLDLPDDENEIPVHVFEQLGDSLEQTLSGILPDVRVHTPAISTTHFRTFKSDLTDPCHVVTFTISARFTDESLWNAGGPVALIVDPELTRAIVSQITGRTLPPVLSLFDFIAAAPTTDACVGGFKTMCAPSEIEVSETELELQPDGVSLGMRSPEEPMYLVNYEVRLNGVTRWFRVCCPIYTHEVVIAPCLD